MRLRSIFFYKSKKKKVYDIVKDLVYFIDNYTNLNVIGNNNMSHFSDRKTRGNKFLFMKEMGLRSLHNKEAGIFLYWLNFEKWLYFRQMQQARPWLVHSSV